MNHNFISIIANAFVIFCSGSKLGPSHSKKFGFSSRSFDNKGEEEASSLLSLKYGLG